MQSLSNKYYYTNVGLVKLQTYAVNRTGVRICHTVIFRQPGLKMSHLSVGFI